MLNELSRLLGTPLVMPIKSITGVSHDSRAVKPGDVYIAISGAMHDGHEFIDDAIRAGAVSVIVNDEHQDRLANYGIPGWAVANTRDVMGDVASIVYGHPTSKLHLVGVTGTNGKTSTTHIIAHLATGLFHSSGTVGTLGAFAKGIALPVNRTTPEAPELQKILSHMCNEHVEAVAIEVASHALAQGRVNGCLFDAAVFTNLSQDHLDFHGDMHAYFKAKSLLFTHYLPQSQAYGKHPFAVIGLSTIWGDQLIKSMPELPAYTYSSRAEVKADFVAENVCLTASACDFDVVFGNAKSRVRLPLGGGFQVENALGALAWFVGAGGKLDDGIRLLQSCPQIPGRFEIIKSEQPFDVVVDYAHTPDGLENVLSTGRNLCKGRLITVFGCGGDRDRTKRPQMGAIAQKYSDFVIVTSDNPRTENPDVIIKDILIGMTESYTGVTELDRKRAIALAIESASSGDLIVIAGKGHETYQIIGQDVLPFDDRIVAAEALARCI